MVIYNRICNFSFVLYTFIECRWNATYFIKFYDSPALSLKFNKNWFNDLSLTLFYEKSIIVIHLTSQKQFMQQIPLGINGSVLYPFKNNFFTSNPCFPCHMMWHLHTSPITTTTEIRWFFVAWTCVGNMIITPIHIKLIV